jgi:hypothetical protein
MVECYPVIAFAASKIVADEKILVKRASQRPRGLALPGIRGRHRTGLRYDPCPIAIHLHALGLPLLPAPLASTLATARFAASHMA